MWISCGAALFNLRLAIRMAGHEAVAWLLPDPDGDPALLASVEVETSHIRRPAAAEQSLYDAIGRRHTCSWPFTGEQVDGTTLARITRAAARERGWLRILFPFQVTRWRQAAAQAQDELMCDKQAVAELRRWTRDAGPGLGVPAPAWGPRPASRYPPVRDFGPGWRDGRPAAQFETHPQLLALATDGDWPLDWLRAGKALQRALLEATRHGVAASFLAQPLECADRRDEPRCWPGAWPFQETPQMIIRVGYPARPLPVTPREACPDVVDLRTHPPRQVLPPSEPSGERN